MGKHESERAEGDCARAYIRSWIYVFLPSDSVWLISRDWSPRTIRMRTAKNQKWYLSQKKWYLSHFAKTQKEILTLYPEVTPEPT